MPPPNVDADFYLIVVSSHQMAAIKGQGSAHLFIFLSLHSTSQTTSNCPPHMFQPSRVSSPMHPLKGEADFWLVVVFPHRLATAKAKVPPHPLSLYFDPSFQIPPNEQTPTARGLCMVMGSGGDMIWWRLCSTHEERRAKPLEGRVGTALLVVGCCV